MENKYLSPSEALKRLNESALLKSETSDGYLTIKKKSKTLFEINVYTEGEETPATLEGNIKSVLKTLNDSKLNKGFYIATP